MRPISRWEALRQHFLPLLLLMLFCLAYLWRIVFGGQILAGPDAFTYFYPMYEYASERLLQGQLPLWNPYLFMGSPFLANPQSGVLYPLHWPLFFFFDAPHMATATLTLHLILMASFMYVFLVAGQGLSRYGAFLGATAFVLGGLAGSQAEHFNQVEVLAWMPLQILCLDRSLRAWEAKQTKSVRTITRWLALSAILSGLQLLAGHIQAVYISHLCVALYALFRALSREGSVRERLESIAVGWTLLFVVALIALGLASVQLLPTLELASRSVRSEGLSYRQATSFSFGPRSWLLGLLPHFGSEEPFSEYVVYVGVSGLFLAALGARTRRAFLPLSLAGAGLFLSLGIYNPVYYVAYRLIPGIALFRVPARWLTIAVFGLAMLIALGLDELIRKPCKWRFHPKPLSLILVVILMMVLLAQPKPALVTVVIWVLAIAAFTVVSVLPNVRGRSFGVGVLLVAELMFASNFLGHNHTTTPVAYTASRRAAQVISDQGSIGRFLSIITPEFDPGDMVDLVSTAGLHLSVGEKQALVTASKWQEVLARNLPLHENLYSIEGYDGGVLPTNDFLLFQSLFMEPEYVALDGRLGERLTSMPALVLLELADVRYVVMDRTRDLWLEGIYYDLGQPLVLSEIPSVVALPETSFATDTIGLLYSCPPGSDVAFNISVEKSNAVAGQYKVSCDSSGSYAEDTDGSQVTANRVIGQYYHLELPLNNTSYADAAALTRLGGTGQIVIHALSLINNATTTGLPVNLGSLSVINYGDVKVYSATNYTNRVFVSSCTATVEGNDEALAVMRQPEWIPSERPIIEGGSGVCANGGNSGASILDYRPEKVVIEARTSQTGYLILKDSFYPGWRASVDGWEAPILRANLVFRAVELEPGEHVVEFVFRPNSLKAGGVISSISIVFLILLLLASTRWPLVESSSALRFMK